MKVLFLDSETMGFRECELRGEKVGLKFLQEKVGGYIEIPLLSEKFARANIDTIINEEGKLIEGLKPSIAIVDKESNKILDIVFGNVVFTSHDDRGNNIGLTVEQINIIRKEFKMKCAFEYRGKTYSSFALFV